MNDIVHFEQLWEKSEEISSKNPTDEMELLGKVSSVVDEIRDIYKVSGSANDKNLLQGMKSKAIGRLLISLAALSGKENIDVYAAMKDQLDILKLKDQVNF